MVFATNALITKPAISIAPMIAVAYLGHYGYNRMNSVASGVTMSSISANSELGAAMITLTCVTSLVIGSIQFATWLLYRPPAKL